MRAKRKRIPVVQRFAGVVAATEEQLNSVGITDVPPGSFVEIYEIDKYHSVHGPASKMSYNYELFDYIIPTCWVRI